MGYVGVALLVSFLLCGIVRGEQKKTEKPCPSTIVDCVCTEKDGNFYTVQINTSTTAISDNATGTNRRCVADRDPLALCEARNCVIIPNGNFLILFKEGKKMSPSNYLKAKKLVAKSQSSSNTSNTSSPSNKTTIKPGPGPQKGESSAFYPIELTYPRMIHGEETHRLVKREDFDELGQFVPPANPQNPPEAPEAPLSSQLEDKADLQPNKADETFGSEDFNMRSEGSQGSEDKGLYRSAYWGGGNSGYACRVPQLRNSEVTCWKWPNWQSCRQTCIYGHGIESSRGTVKSATFTCRNSENAWKPRTMTDCQPYLNCKVRLRSPGDLKCVEPTNAPAYCDITCQQYDNQSAVKVRAVCDERQGGMTLPFCAVLDNSWVSSIKAP